MRKHIRTIAIATAVSRPKAEGGCKTQPNQSQTALKSVPNRSKIDLGGVWRVSEPSWMVLGASRHHLGAVSGRPGGVLGFLEAVQFLRHTAIDQNKHAHAAKPPLVGV